MNDEQSVSLIKGVGKATAEKLEKLGIKNVWDLLHHFPFRYEEYGERKALNEIPDGSISSVGGKLIRISQFRSRGGRQIQTATFESDGKKFYAMWFSSPFLLKALKTDQEYLISGKIKREGSKITFWTPKWREDDGTNLGIVPVYHETAGLNSSKLRKLISNVTSDIVIDEFLPVSALKDHKLIDIRKALQYIHDPKTQDEISLARRRLSIDELLAVQLKALLLGIYWKKLKGVPVDIKLSELEKFVAGLPFDATGEQKSAIREVLADIKKDIPMNRLLVGDVGSGKTIVALCALAMCAKSGKKGLLLSPTVILARQHYETAKKILGDSVNVGLVTSKDKINVDANILIGTHSLITQDDYDEQLAMLVIDEQQRFGVSQRNALMARKVIPHILMMTATPIPRTLAVLEYGNLEYSYIKEKPLGRKEIKTAVRGEGTRGKVWDFAQKEINNGRQVFVVVPRIENKTEETRSINEMILKLENRFGKTVALLHGKLSSEDKEKQMHAFLKGEKKIMLSTTMVEVGVDVPNATVMIIEDGDRFGLSQLHQLRGRVGRSDKQSYCFVLCKDEQVERLSILERENDGLRIAQADLELRGPGEVFGISQSGHVYASMRDFWSDENKKTAYDIAQFITLDEQESVKILTKMKVSIANLELSN